MNVVTANRHTDRHIGAVILRSCVWRDSEDVFIKKCYIFESYTIAIYVLKINIRCQNTKSSIYARAER